MASQKGHIEKRITCLALLQLIGLEWEGEKAEQ